MTTYLRSGLYGALLRQGDCSAQSAHDPSDRP